MKARYARSVAGLLGALAVAGALLVGGAGAASAHPLGNATVNHYDGLHVYADRVTDHAVEDVAEIPTLQRRPAIDVDGDGSVGAVEATRYATTRCAALARATVLTIDGTRATFGVQRSSYVERLGAIRLDAGRLECDLEARADLGRAARVGFDSRWDSAGVGWHEVTAVATGVTVRSSPFPATSISGELATYPNDLLSAPLDVRSGSFGTVPGGGPSTYAAVADLPGAGIAARAIERVTRVFDEKVGSDHLTAGVVALTILLAMLLGAGHACLPGHGKTIMAAYLVGRRGRARDVVAVGATVTLTHTFSVLVLGLLISVSGAFAPTQAEQMLAVVSGLIVAGVGVALLGSAVRGGFVRRSHVSRAAEPVEALAVVAPSPALVTVGAPSGDHAHPHPHVHPAADTHRHGPLGSHSHEPQAFGRRGLVGLGVAGGLVPSPSALLVLLAAVALGRGVLGVVLVLAYGLGMAGTLTAAGLLLVRLRDRIARSSTVARFAGLASLARVVPFVTAGLVLVVGVALTLRAASGRL